MSIKIFFYHPDISSGRQNRQLVFEYKLPYKLVASLRSATEQNLQFPTWWSILEIVRTHFRAAGGGANSREITRQISELKNC